MKPETKDKLKKFGSKAWEITKVSACVVGAIGATIAAFAINSAAGGHTYEPGYKTETEEEKRAREEAERKRREEHEAFLNSLTPNERKIYEKVEDLESENSSLRSRLSDISEDNERLQSRIRNLESDDD